MRPTGRGGASRLQAGVTAPDLGMAHSGHVALVYLGRRKIKLSGAGAGTVQGTWSGAEKKEDGVESDRKDKSGAKLGGDGLLPEWGSHLIILNRSGSLILTVRATFQDT